MNDDKPLIRALRKQLSNRPPIWLMRQAGRHLPEYLELRAGEPDFIKFCLNRKLIEIATIQPLRRYHLDAAIIFSDILVVPHALGQKVTFEPGFGPRLGDLSLQDVVNRESVSALDCLEPLYDAIGGVKSLLSSETALIGFSGAPWTLATYMIGGKGEHGRDATKMSAIHHPKNFAILIDKLTNVIIEHLIRQIDAGVDVVQLFDSWAGNLNLDMFEDFVIAPTTKIVEAIRTRRSGIPIIGFPKGAGPQFRNFARDTQVHGVSIDYTIPPIWAKNAVSPYTTIQGNLDPLLLMCGGTAMDKQAERLLETFEDAPFIFNLGHGLHPETPIDNVLELIKRVRH